MKKPIIGLTCQLFPEPIPRSSVNQQYVDAVIAAGGSPVLLPIGVDSNSIHDVYSLLDGILLPGGDDISPSRYGQSPHPMVGDVSDARDSLEIEIARLALRDDKPILGICRGIQLLAVAANGTLWQDVPSEYESALPHDVREHGRDHLCHEIDVEPDSRLAEVIGTHTAVVNSFHHQAVRNVPNDFRVSARAHDGIIEAIESKYLRFAMGVQCHPEAMWQTTAPEFAGLFRSFVDEARARPAQIVAEAS